MKKIKLKSLKALNSDIEKLEKFVFDCAFDNNNYPAGVLLKIEGLTWELTDSLFKLKVLDDYMLGKIKTAEEFKTIFEHLENESRCS